MKCKNCNAENNDTRQTCCNCGCILDDVNEPTLVFKAIEEEEKKEIESVSIDDFVEEPEEKQKIASPAIALWAVILIVAVAVIVAGIIIITKLSNVGDDHLPSAAIELNIPTPEITRLADENDAKYISARFFGKAGDKIYLGCSDKYFTFTEATLDLKLYLSDLFDKSYVFTTETIYASLSASYVLEGKKYSLDTPAFEMPVPVAPLTIISPEENTKKIYQTEYTIKLDVTPGSTVTINGEALTNAVSTSGILEYKVEVAPQSSNCYDITVLTPYCRQSAASIILQRDAMPVPLSLSANNPTVSGENIIELIGTTDPGAEITCSLPATVLENALYNTFKVTINMTDQKYGHYDILITSSNEKGISTISHSLWYWPAEGKYTTRARAFEEKLITNTNAFKNTIFVFKNAKVTKLLSKTEFIVEINENNKTHQLLIEYEYQKLSPVLGKEYKIFADVDGIKDGMPYLKARYIY